MTERRIRGGKIWLVEVGPDPASGQMYRSSRLLREDLDPTDDEMEAIGAALEVMEHIKRTKA
jgi:predicted RNase H-like nuclease